MYFGFNNVTIEFGKKLVLENLTADIPKGKITTIIGKNGCGKSSLLKIISRAVKQSNGNAILKDKNIRQYQPKVLAKSIGYLPQVHSSPPDIDIYKLVSYGRYPYMKFGKSLTPKDREIVCNSIELTGLTDIMYQKIGTLSGGERQRAWIAMILCQQPSILILDERTTYLDISYQIEILELIKKLNTEMGLTIVMVLHDINLASRYSDVLIAIKNGDVYSKGTPREVLTHEKVKEIYGLDAKIVEDKDNNCPFFIPLKKAK
jgi:iron complex transport system ATP-binding protein